MNPFRVRFDGSLEEIGFMPLTRGEALGYDAYMMAFKFTMRIGQPNCAMPNQHCCA
jgi:hypothetical protein